MVLDGSIQQQLYSELDETMAELEFSASLPGSSGSIG